MKMGFFLRPEYLDAIDILLEPCEQYHFISEVYDYAAMALYPEDFSDDEVKCFRIIRSQLDADLDATDRRAANGEARIRQRHSIDV